MNKDRSGPRFCTCLFIGLLVAAFWAAPALVLRLVIFTENQYETPFKAVITWCIGLNGLTLITNLVDKVLAFSDCGCCRVPELVLHLLTLLGGGASTVLSMIFFCHKFNKGSYKRRFIATAGFSIVFIGGAYALAYGLDNFFTNTHEATTTVPTLTTSIFF